MVKRVHYDPEADILYIVLREGPAEDTVEVDEDIFVEVDEEGNIVGIEVWRASKNILDQVSEAIAERIRRQLAAQRHQAPRPAQANPSPTMRHAVST